jgi:pimeloyl-ACP methyl ester carboxylesterase
LLDWAGALNTPAYKRVLADRPGYTEFEARKWADLSEIMWGTIARELAYQPDDLAALAALAVPLLVLVGEQDEPFVLSARLIEAAIAHADVAIVPNAGHSPQFENPEAWIAALTGFLSALPAAAR